MTRFYDKHHRVQCGDGHESFILEKAIGSDWTNIAMVTNNENNGEVVLRSKEHLEQLHFAIGQLLND